MTLMEYSNKFYCIWKSPPLTSELAVFTISLITGICDDLVSSVLFYRMVCNSLDFE